MSKETKDVNIANLSKDDAITTLIRDNGFSFKEAEKYWKENGSSTRSGPFQDILDYLAEADRTQADLAAYILDFGTKNEARWFTQRDAIRRLSVTVRATKGFKDVPATPEQKEALKAKVES